MTKKIEIDGISGSSDKEHKKENDNNSWLEGDYTNRHKDSKKCKSSQGNDTRGNGKARFWGFTATREEGNGTRGKIAFKF